MGYHLNFTLIWRNFDKLAYGLVTSLELAIFSIALGIAIGLSLAVIYVGGGRVSRSLIGMYVEFVRNVPLLLLVYLVFYGLPTAIDVAYDATTSFVATLSVYSGAYLVEVFRSGLDAVPRGLIDAGKAIGLNPFQRLVYVRIPAMLRITLPALFHSLRIRRLRPLLLFRNLLMALSGLISIPLELLKFTSWLQLCISLRDIQFC